MSGRPDTVLEHLALEVTQGRADSVVERHAARRALLDWTATVVAGAGTPVVSATADVAVLGGPGGAWAVASGRRIGTRDAALVNGVAAHALELDDIFRPGMYHPGAPTVAAALAVAQEVGASVDGLLSAIIAGYEVGCYLAELVHPGHYRFWHPTGTIGSIGAAAAAAALLGLDRDRLGHALAGATTMAAGLQQAVRSDAMSKAVHAGRAAETGVLAALLARAGVTGERCAFDGESGLAAPSATDPPGAWRDLEYGGRIRGVTIKRHACCGHTIAAADAALELVARGVDLDDVVSSEVVTYSTAVEVADRPRPRSVQDAKFSLQYCVAAALVLGALNQDAFSAERRACPAIARLMRMTRVHAAADYDAVHPQRCARVTLNYADGTSVVAERFTRVGDPDDPLTDDQLHAKFMRLASPGLGRAAAESLMSAVWHADGSESVHAIDWPVVVAR